PFFRVGCMTLLVDPVACGAVESLEGLCLDELPAAQLQGVLVACASLRGRVAAVEAAAGAALGRVAPRGGGGAPGVASWLARETRVSRLDAKRAVQRAAVIAALPALGAALAAGAVSTAHIDVLAAIVPAGLVPAADVLLARAQACVPEELRAVA